MPELLSIYRLPECLAPFKPEFFLWLLDAQQKLLQFIISQWAIDPARRSRTDKVIFNIQCKIRFDKPYIHQSLACLRIEYHLQNPLAHGRSLSFTPSYFLIIWLRGL